MNVTVNVLNMMGIDSKYTVLGYLFGFIGSLQFTEILFAFGLGFVGAFGGWVFERLKSKLIDKNKNNG